jgi:CitMHS family citrate-Mg2+:H+ or citrate-Ca2+:H+ symporter
MNILPWGGPTARAASALGVEMSNVFVPMILPMIVTGAWCTFVAFILGKREARRLGKLQIHDVHGGDQSIAEVTGGDASLARPKLLWVNALLTIVLMVLLIKDTFPLAVLFMIATAIALMINYPRPMQQKERIETYAVNLVPVVALIFAAGIFVGILSGTKMVDAMANSVIGMVPEWMGPYMAVVLLWHPAHPGEDGCRVRHWRDRDRPRLSRRPASPPVEPAGRIHLPAGGLGESGVW